MSEELKRSNGGASKNIGGDESTYGIESEF